MRRLAMWGWRSFAVVALLALMPLMGAAASSAAGAGGPSRVVVIVLENHSYKSVVGNPSAPFINGTLIAHGQLEQQYYSVYPSSGENYLAMTAGITDSTPPPGTPNLFASLPSSVPWRAFEESMPSTCYTKAKSPALVPGTSVPLYKKGHNPAVRFDNVTDTGLCANDVPLNPAHFDPAHLPSFSYVVPNQCNDMHTMPTTGSCPRWDGGTNTGGNPVALADAWLARFVPLVAGSATVVVTWDEGSGGSQRVPTVLYGLGVTHGVDRTTYNHFSLEAGLYRHFGVAPVPGHGARAVPLHLTGTPSPTPETLSVGKTGTGKGSITSNPAGIRCGRTCSSAYPYGTTVALTALPAKGSTFKGWSGACSGPGTCRLTLRQKRSVTASFARKPACIVPKLKRKTLRTAKHRITRAHCATGKVTHRYSVLRKGLVISQRPRPAKRLPNGARVNVAISKGRRP
jgi:List-Bact-rpt repeat protein